MSGGSWSSADEKWKLTDSEILKAIAAVHPKFYVGCRAGRASRFAVLDIDAGSKYHTGPQLQKLLRILADAGLAKTSLYRSSYSGGWHLYIFFSEPISSSDLRRQLLALLSVHGFETGKGVLEVFPHRGDSSMGQGLRLPLQPGWAWLNKETQEVDVERNAIAAPQALELFIDALDGDCHSYFDFRRFKEQVQQLEQRQVSIKNGEQNNSADNVVPIRRTALKDGEFADFARSVFRQAPPGMNVDTWYKGRLFHLNGLSGPSQRAEAIFCLSHYLFYGDPSRQLPALGYGYEDERRWAIEHFLESRHNGQSKDINAGRSDATTQADRAANWRPQHKRCGARKFTAQRPVAWVRENANRQTGARKRITSALEALKAEKRSFTTVQLQKAAGCSRETLYNHADIWRKDYEDLAEGFFAICTDEYNAVGGAAPPESTPLPTAVSKIAPPGLLAARRIAYEISNRSQREKQKKEKAVLNANEAAENDWKDKVSVLTEKRPSELPTARCKTLLSVLVSYLMVAPCEETANSLQSYIHDLRKQTMDRMKGPGGLVLPIDRSLILILDKDTNEVYYFNSLEAARAGIEPYDIELVEAFTNDGCVVNVRVDGKRDSFWNPSPGTVHLEVTNKATPERIHKFLFEDLKRRNVPVSPEQSLEELVEILVSRQRPG